MFLFLRKVRKSFLSSGQASKYMAYAFGEIVLVVAGILIALQINNWNEEERSSQKEKRLIELLIANLEYNEDQLTSFHEYYENQLSSIQIIRNHISHKIPYHDSLNRHFYGTFSIGSTPLASSAYETLKSIGLDLIRSDENREMIIDLYEISYPELQISMKEIVNIWESGMIVPYYTDHFTFEQTGMTPNDYDAILSDQKFVNILSGRDALFRNIMFLILDLRDKTTSLSGSLQQYLTD